MKTKIWKAFMDYEKEEKWLNEMTAKGFAMTHYSIFRYTFEDCAPGEYTYRIQLLEHDASHPETICYIRFLEESGVEHVDNYLMWAYFRKNAFAGEFEIYTDFDMRVAHYKRIAALFLILAIVQIPILASNFSTFMANMADGAPIVVNAIACAVSIIVVTIMLVLRGSYMKRIRKLEREREISE